MKLHRTVHASPAAVVAFVIEHLQRKFGRVRDEELPRLYRVAAEVALGYTVVFVQKGGHWRPARFCVTCGKPLGKGAWKWCDVHAEEERLDRNEEARNRWRDRLALFTQTRLMRTFGTLTAHVEDYIPDSCDCGGRIVRTTNGLTGVDEFVCVECSTSLGFGIDDRAPRRGKVRSHIKNA